MIDPKNITGKICNWLRAKVEEAGAAGVIVGLSGGVDSAVTAAVATKALGKDKVYGLILPCQSHPTDRRDAEEAAKTFDIAYDVLDLEWTLNDLRESAARTRHGKQLNRMAVANTKARLRMTSLYMIAAQLNYLVLGTGNKSEIMIGYYTKYGDGGVDLEPLGELYKSEVYQLAEYLGVPRPIRAKAPTAGLWERQTDEDELGMTYDTLEKALRVIENNGVNEYDSGELPAKELERVRKIFQTTRHKREMPPSCAPA